MTCVAKKLSEIFKTRFRIKTSHLYRQIYLLQTLMNVKLSVKGKSIKIKVISVIPNKWSQDTFYYPTEYCEIYDINSVRP